MNDDLFVFEPSLVERIWGGEYLKDLYNDRNSLGPVGEAWLISGLKANPSQIVTLAGEKSPLDSFYRKNRQYFPFGWKDEFPLLVKMIDAQTKLSVQVHPNDEYARKNENGSGKSECWYILDANPDSFLVVGHHAQSKTELRQQVMNHDYDSLLHKVKIQPGDFVYIPSGLLHAIGDGVRLVEVQQPSDITYRFYDYNRKDASGNVRELHVEKAIDVTITPSPSVEIRNYAHSSGIVSMVKTPYFQVEKWSTTAIIQFHNIRRQTHFFVVLSGEAKVNTMAVKTGDAFMSSCTNQNINVYGKVELLAITIPDGGRL